MTEISMLEGRLKWDGQNLRFDGDIINPQPLFPRIELKIDGVEYVCYPKGDNSANKL